MNRSHRNSLLVVVLLSMVAIFWQNCSGGGSTTENPLASTISVAFSKFDAFPFDDEATSTPELATGPYVSHLQLCIKSFRAIHENGDEYFLRRIFDDTVLNPNGTLVGFLEDEIMPEGNYTANMLLGFQCNFGGSLILENSYGQFTLTEGPLVEGLVIRQVVDDNNTPIWSVNIQDIITGLAQSQSNRDILCVLDPDRPPCQR